jgi:hypothetical protein
MSIVKSLHSTIRTHPQIPRRILSKRVNNIRSQAVPARDAPEFAAVKMAQAAIEGSNPDLIVSADEHRANAIGGQPILNCVESRRTIQELIEPALGAYPNGAFTILEK